MQAHVIRSAYVKFKKLILKNWISILYSSEKIRSVEHRSVYFPNNSRLSRKETISSLLTTTCSKHLWNFCFSVKLEIKYTNAWILTCNKSTLHASACSSYPSFCSNYVTQPGEGVKKKKNSGRISCCCVNSCHKFSVES